MSDAVARVGAALDEVLDPELGLSVVQLGLVYGIEADAGRVHVRMTMTTPACPLGEEIVRSARERIEALGLGEVEVELVWDPPWGPERMRAGARALLGWGDAEPAAGPASGPESGLVTLRVPERIPERAR